MTTLFDDEESNDASVCISILCSLFNMMIRNQRENPREDMMKLPYYIESQGTSIFESSSQQFNLANRKIKLEIEHSRTYIGYKLLWVTSLFIEGKKFPSGNLSSFKWHCFIYDIVRFLTNEKFLNFFLEFDAYSFLHIVKKLFME